MPLKNAYEEAINKTKIRDETKAAMKEAYDNAVNEVNRIYDEATSQNNETTSQRETSEVASDIAKSTDETSQNTDETSQSEAQAKSAQNNDVASEAMNEKAQTKKAADEDGQENAGQVSNTTLNNNRVGDEVNQNKSRKDKRRERRALQLQHIAPEETRQALINLAIKVWNNRSEEGRVSFAPSEKLKGIATKIFGHDIGEVFITASDVRHIKDHHSAGEDARDQMDIKPEFFGELYDIINNFDNAVDGGIDELGNKGIKLSKGIDGASFSIVSERGKQNAEIKTFYKHKKKKAPPMLDAQKNPEQNVQNVSVTPSSNVGSTIPQTEATSKDKNETKEDTKEEKRTQNEDAFSNGKLNQDTRGIYDTANNIVTLTENADESTFIHEMGHHYYNVLKQAAKIAGKNSQAKKDLDSIDDWTNYKKGIAAEYEDTASEKEFADLEKEIIKAEEKGDTKKAEELKARWKQERWARGVEEYLSEGIAPTAKLRKIFNDFKKWLKEIYRGLKGAGAKPSDDVRAVMERMIASDKEILTGKATRLSGDTKAAYDKALADLKAAGVKNAEANAYLVAKMAERLSSAYKEAGENKTAVELLPEIQAQDKSAKNQKEAVRKKYEGTKEWLKAPNGEDTNLTEDQWLTVRTPAFKKWFGDWENDPKNASKVVDENGEPKVVYHGTARADRVGDIFRPDRATSGPMAFFTDSLAIGTNYSRDKADTSLSREDLDEYKNQFTVEVKGRNGKTETVNIVDYWKYLSPKERMNIAKVAPSIGLNDDYEITLKPGNKHGTGDYVHSLREAKGNHLEALINEWLYSGNLYNEEGEFLEVLKLAGVENVKYNDPDYREEAVYTVFMNCRKPLNTTKISDKLFSQLEEASEEAQENYDPDEGYGADSWDKTNIAPEDWIERLSDDRENGTTYTWTIVPDWVTETLKKGGYDGIEDTGGKYHSLEHTVYIPFSSTQIKSATDNNGEFNENDPSILHQFAGEKSKTANINKLNEAKEMEKNGESKEDIYKATGWIKDTLINFPKTKKF